MSMADDNVKYQLSLFRKPVRRLCGMAGPWLQHDLIASITHDWFSHSQSFPAICASTHFIFLQTKHRIRDLFLGANALGIVDCCWRVSLMFCVSPSPLYLCLSFVWCPHVCCHTRLPVFDFPGPWPTIWHAPCLLLKTAVSLAAIVPPVTTRLAT